MEERQDPQLELLTRIHNQLVDLTKMLAEIEMSKTSSELLKNKLRQIMTSAQHIDSEGRVSDAGLSRAQKIIDPTDHNITPGEANLPAPKPAE